MQIVYLSRHDGMMVTWYDVLILPGEPWTGMGAREARCMHGLFHGDRTRHLSWAGAMAHPHEGFEGQE